MSRGSCRRRSRRRRRAGRVRPRATRPRTVQPSRASRNGGRDERRASLSSQPVSARRCSSRNRPSRSRRRGGPSPRGHLPSTSVSLMCRLGATQDAAGLTVVGAPGPRCSGPDRGPPEGDKTRAAALFCRRDAHFPGRLLHGPGLIMIRPWTRRWPPSQASQRATSRAMLLLASDSAPGLGGTVESARCLVPQCQPGATEALPEVLRALRVTAF